MQVNETSIIYTQLCKFIEFLMLIDFTKRGKYHLMNRYKIECCSNESVLLFFVDLSGFPKCYKETAIPLLARIVGAWPLSKERANQTQAWLRGVASRSTLHYVTVVGSSNFLNGIIELVRILHN